MAKFAGGRIEAWVGPRELGAADDLEAVIVEFIEGADRSLDIAVQELDSEPIAQAILDARWKRDVDVRMYLEQDYLVQGTLPKLRKPKAGEDPELALRAAQWSGDERRGLEANRRILAALLRSGVDVKADYNPALFHQKFALRDYRRTATRTSALLTGSANWTHTDTHTNYNHVVVFHDARICRSYETEFDQIRGGSFGRGMHGEVPRAFNVEGVPVKVLFAPDHTPELEIMKQMLKAEKRVDFAIFTFAGSSGIDDALLALKAAGVRVTGAIDPKQGRQKWAATPWLHAEGIEVHLPREQPGFGKLHHKLMVIDDAVVVAGSFNYTAPANEYNDENLFVIGSPYADLPRNEGGPTDEAACAAITAFFREEIERIERQGVRYEPEPAEPGAAEISGTLTPMPAGSAKPAR